MSKAHIIYLPHGGGPLLLLGDPGHTALSHCLQNLPRQLPRPDAIIVISAHWECPQATVTGAPTPELIYDYYGFPPESYQLHYPAPGAPELAQRIDTLLSRAGMPSHIDSERGFDHGLFVPLSLMYPQADLPCLQLSLLQNLSAEAHLALGEALAPLTEENVLIVGSGLSFHNMRAFGQAIGETENLQFEQWLARVCGDNALSAQERRQALQLWQEAPGARFCHPREEHLLPLHVCAGLAGFRSAEQVFSDQVLGKRCSGYLWSAAS